MSIVRMKRLRLIALSADRRDLFEGFMRLGTVEITGATERLKDQEWAALTSRDENTVPMIKARENEIKAAIDNLDKFVPVKKNIFALRPVMKFDDIFDTGEVASALETAGQINELAHSVASSHADENRINNKCLSLEPWRKFELPLDISSTREAAVILGVCPATASVEKIIEALSEAAPMSELFLINSDREQHYLLFICHKTELDAGMDSLKRAGFSRAVFKDVYGTADEVIKTSEMEIQNTSSSREALIEKIATFSDCREMLKRCADRVAQELVKEQARENLITTKEAFFLEGWTLAPETKKLEALLDKYDCWFELSDPEKGDDIPIKLFNTKLIEPFNMVTEMYGLPKYTNIDPNPLIAPFFALFFGMMYGDVAYGLVLLLLGIFVTKKLKPRGVIGQMFRLMKILGVTTMFFGVIYGGIFGDSISTIGRTFFSMPDDFEFKIYVGDIPIFGMFDPLDDPLKALIIAMIIGGVHIMTGMAIKAYLLCRDGRPLDALMDVGSWWLLFAGFALLATGHGPVVVLCGAAALLLTQGRRAPSIAGKIVGGLASLYGISSYFSDVLSYSRLMALALASSVIAMVFNLLASMIGGIYIIGVFLFTVLFLFGHAFNMGVNIISTYVHGARLQYLEYFNRFYEGGGTPFAPLIVKTRFVDIIKEE